MNEWGGQSQDPQYAPVQTSPSSWDLHVANTPAKGQKEPVYGLSDAQGYSPTPFGYPAVQHLEAQQYLLAPGTIDLSQRQLIDNPPDPSKPDPYSYGSEYSARSRMEDGNIMSYPTIYDGQVHDWREAFDHAQQTGQHLGIYHSSIPDHVINEVEDVLHSRPIIVNGQQMNGDLWAKMKQKGQYVKPNKRVKK